MKLILQARRQSQMKTWRFGHCPTYGRNRLVLKWFQFLQNSRFPVLCIPVIHRHMLHVEIFC
ncbi:hypothetical protein MPL3356_60602 [Mesorhizobium plurifarium]|uniref:Uncharacterized protein n=1 Tax=Mesorhizobium plurifarium TaxID=69974 RepID=A0A090EFH5_MESPL|nr:hypothetical protein MPL3356_60602 [Mesorhizobium plurifarium]